MNILKWFLVILFISSPGEFGLCINQHPRDRTAKILITGEAGDIQRTEEKYYINFIIDLKLKIKNVGAKPALLYLKDCNYSVKEWLAKTVVDSTGNAAIAAAAGAPCTYTTQEHIAVQGTGLPPRELGAGYTNTDYTFVDETDTIDIWRSFVLGRGKYQNAYDLGQLIDTRERRQIIGDYLISPLDIWNCRTYPDTISIHVSNFDTHGFTIHPVFMIRPPDREKLAAHVPYRALIPQGIDGILVTGLGASAHRDAMPGHPRPTVRYGLRKAVQ